MPLTKEEKNKRQSDTRAANHHNRYQNDKSSIIHAFDRARKERWTHAQLLKWRNEWLFTEAYKSYPQGIKYQLTGVWDTCNDLLWRELKVCYNHPDTGILTLHDELKDVVDLCRVDTDTCKMCFKDEQGNLFPYT